ncbi:4'-phosphopantetheinyl transferase family protein [Clostridium sp. C105KSO13]|uniref:4'-phosphopantetheinyl transferase family protein n=1 Tax=Clostridium sp. C105KSO13 TaxID=1776045 RepID=UPI0007406177|nr:4'-phosphopantetheinyl transferase superfamily protein [Clostridium sp. C105KSO13]CUX32176.1 4'-phosphopantetheinyl transferase sfp [Clostridium sp. C105KSO13]
MIRTWIADIRPLYEIDKYQTCYETLPIFRKEKADKIQSQRGKAQSAGAWALLDRIRKEYGIAEEAAFNLSHSGDYVLCSVALDYVSEPQVGCDIESVKRARLKVAERFFCPSEYKMILEEENKELQDDLFYRFWVLKESFMKATRQGMAMDTKGFEIQLSEPPTLLKRPDGYPQEYYYREYDAGIPYKIAVCSTDKKIDSKIRMELKL